MLAPPFKLVVTLRIPRGAESVDQLRRLHRIAAGFKEGGANRQDTARHCAREIARRALSISSSNSAPMRSPATTRQFVGAHHRGPASALVR